MLPSSLLANDPAWSSHIVSFREETTEQPRSLEQRVSALEKQMRDLQDLPERFKNLETRFDGVETRFVRVETRLGGVETRLGVVESQIVQLRTDIGDEFSAIRWEMKTGFAELGAQMRLLHEDALSRIARMTEGRRSRKR